MSAYWLGRAKVTDPDIFKGYSERAPGIIVRHGGEFLGRGRTKILEGAPDYERFFLIRFPSFEAAAACHASPEYQEAARLREGGGFVEVVIVEGDVRAS